MNEILHQRIIKLIAITYALNVEIVWEIYNKIGSVDKVLEMAKNGEIKS